METAKLDLLEARVKKIMQQVQDLLAEKQRLEHLVQELVEERALIRAKIERMLRHLEEMQVR